MNEPTHDQTKALAKSSGFGRSHGKPGGPLKDRFLYPPYSIWNTRDRFWINRRRAWLRMGIKSEEGRGGKLTFNVPMMTKDLEHGGRGNASKVRSQTSIFDPVICELVYSWWCQPGGVVVDPFAGGSVLGIVAAMLGFKYWGSELRQVQVSANMAQRLNIKPQIVTAGGHPPKWVCGDSAQTLHGAPACDMVFSCPPYGNLETYSKDPADISNMAYEQFLDAYGGIIYTACDRLRDDRFACFVVSNYRDKKTGVMRDLVGDTTRAFAVAGMELYNDIVLVNSVGTGALRAQPTFINGSLKVVKTHQNVLVYLKGDAKRAAANIPMIANAKEATPET